jgi:2-oxoglutarate ferredoxin oxidoreductase subunit gamma
MKENWQVVLGGSGGQGLVIAGIVLGEAGIIDGKNVTQTAVYGIASRGGFAKSEVVISEDEIEFPAVEEPNAILALSQEALEKYYGKVAADCIIIYDSSTTHGEYPGEHVYGLPLSEKNSDLKKEKGINAPLNVIGLGALIGATGLVSAEAMGEALKNRFGSRAPANLEAIRAGIDLVSK